MMHKTDLYALGPVYYKKYVWVLVYCNILWSES